MTVWRDLALETLDLDTNGDQAVVVWKRQSDRSWKITADIWNSSMPLATP
jgi:ketosteroid isomerase-like protein